MSTNTTTYTKAIRKGVLRLTEMEVGTTVSGTVEGVEEGKFGAVLVLNVPAVGSVKIFTAGNIKKFFADDQSKGLYNIGNLLSITRKEDFVLKNGMKVSQFTKTSKRASDADTETVTTTPTTTASTKAALQAKLAAARKSA